MTDTPTLGPPTTGRWFWRVVELIRAVDGDTYDLKLGAPYDLGFHQTGVNFYSARFRLLGVDTPERSQTGGSAATAFSDGWIRAALGNESLIAESFKAPASYLPDGQFGRWLVDLWRTDTGIYLRDALIESGFRKPLT